MLVVTSGADRGKEALVGGPRYRVGKNPDNELVLTDDTVSRYHFEVVVEGDGAFLVRDLGSTNGTIVDGARIREAYLRSGATITAGRVRMEVYLPVERVDTTEESPPTLDFDSTSSYRQAKEQWVNDFERRYVAWLLREAKGNISRAARRAEMDRKYLYKLKKKHGL